VDPDDEPELEELELAEELDEPPEEELPPPDEPLRCGGCVTWHLFNARYSFEHCA
jgi:hypothetical protein